MRQSLYIIDRAGVPYCSFRVEFFISPPFPLSSAGRLIFYKEVKSESAEVPRNGLRLTHVRIGAQFRLAVWEYGAADSTAPETDDTTEFMP